MNCGKALNLLIHETKTNSDSEGSKDFPTQKGLIFKMRKTIHIQKLQDIIYKDKSKEVKRAIGVERTER